MLKACLPNDRSSLPEFEERLIKEYADFKEADFFVRRDVLGMSGFGLIEYWLNL